MNARFRFSKTCIVMSALLVCLSPMVSAQTSGGMISGLVTDASGAVMPGVAVTLASREARISRDAMTDEAGSDLQVKQLDFTSFAGNPVYLARETPQHSRIITVPGPVPGKAAAEFDRDRILDVVTEASQPGGLAEVRLVTEYEAYYLDRHNRLPLPVLFVRLNDSDNTMVYIDPRTARVMNSYSSRSRWTRWLYHGLHSIDLPWLYKHRPAWDIIVLVLMLGGTSLCVTSVIIGFQLLRKKLAVRLVQ